MMKQNITFMTLTIIALVITGCSTSTQTDNGKINIVTTIGMIADITKNIGGDTVEVIGLMGPGVDPHLYKASESDVSKLSNAQIIFYGGLHLEARMGEVLEKMSERQIVIAVTDDIDRSQLLDFPTYPGQFDPHVWFNVEMWMQAVEKVRDTLIDYDLGHKQNYEKNAELYLSELKKLDEYVLARANELSKDQRILVTAHDAFGYFGAKYDFEVKGLQGISTQSKSGTKDVQDLVNFIVQREINAVFVESSVPKRNIQAVQQGAQAKGWDVKIGGELFSDAMGDTGTVEGTYIGMVTHNIDTIVDALK